MTTELDFARHTQIRSRIRATLDTLKAEGISTGELIECTGNELHLLKLQNSREEEVCTDPDNWTQRLKENPYEPLEEVRAEHEDFLTELEGLAAQPPPPPREPTDDRRDASAEVSQAEALTPKSETTRVNEPLRTFNDYAKTLSRIPL